MRSMWTSEFEIEWLPKFKNSVVTPKENFTLTNDNKKTHANKAKSKALGSMKSEGLKNLLDNL